MDAIDQILTVAGRLTVGGVLLLAVLALLLEKIVPGTTHLRELAERDEWKRLALTSTRLAADATRAVDPTAPFPPPAASPPAATPSTPTAAAGGAQGGSHP